LKSGHPKLERVSLSPPQKPFASLKSGALAQAPARDWLAVPILARLTSGFMKKEKRLLRVGVLGCGTISQAAHLEAALKARNAELYAVCDVAEDLLQKIAARFEPQVTFSNYDAMLADPKVEAVIVAIADQFHVDAAIRALQAGKHVLVEKPLGTTIADCERLAAQVRDSKLIAQVGTMKRFDPGIRDAPAFPCRRRVARSCVKGLVLRFDLPLR
jgi:hypothetical protein